MASTFTSLLNIRRRIGLAKGDPIPFILYSYRKGARHMNIERSTDGQKIQTLVGIPLKFVFDDNRIL